MSKKIVIIGSGFAGLSAACFMAKAGWQVSVLEKNSTPGGRARQLKEQGFTFDMGPSWYWMPDVFERFFNCFGKKVSDYYTLQKLDPAYRIYWEDSETDIPADYDELKKIFESIEPGSSSQLRKFLEEAKHKYEVGINQLVYLPSQSFTELLNRQLITGIFKLDVFNSVKAHVQKYFKNPQLQQLMEFPVLFLGALPGKIPALYSLMNYAAINGGTWYPDGGMFKIIEAMYKLATGLGVEFYFDHEVTEIIIENNTAKKIVAVTDKKEIPTTVAFDADAVIGAADYHHVETKLLQKKYRNYSENYWNKRVMAPGCLLYYVGLNKRIKNLQHHSLFFDTSFEIHGKEIYETKKWPSAPLFYVSATSITDKTVAPGGCENLFFLIPVAAGLENDTEELRDKYFDIIIERFEKRIGERIKENIVYKKSFAHSDFINEYNAFKGNAYGLANTLMQTAFLKPSCRNKKVKNLFYAGQLTVPGPGVPPSIISGEVVAKEVVKTFQ